MFKVRMFFFSCIMACTFVGSSFAANTPQQQAFEASLFGISEISHFGLDEQRFNKLTLLQQQKILLAKESLFKLLKAIENKDGKPQQYLSNALNKKFPTKQAFVQSLVDDETSLLAMIIGDFSISKDEKNVVFHFSVISFSEGNITVTEHIATIQNSDTGWKISKI